MSEPTLAQSMFALAKSMRLFYVNLIQEGFTEEQALRLTMSTFKQNTGEEK